jgi:hypothetical protein
MERMNVDTRVEQVNFKEEEGAIAEQREEDGFFQLFGRERPGGPIPAKSRSIGYGWPELHLFQTLC